MDVVKCPYCGSELVFYDELEDYMKELDTKRQEILEKNNIDKAV